MAIIDDGAARARRLLGPLGGAALMDGLAPGEADAGGEGGLSLDAQDALALWRIALVSGLKAGEPDLSARQTALLLTVYQVPGPHTVRGLATGLAISKPAVTRALDTLGRLGLLARRRDEHDRRNVLVQRTARGARFVAAFAARIGLAGRAL